MSKNGHNGRNPDGTFAKGNPGGPGRPGRVTETAYLVAMTKIVSLDDWEAIVKKARDDARAGDASARAWLSKYLLPNGVTLTEALIQDATDPDPVGKAVERQKMPVVERLLANMDDY